MAQTLCWKGANFINHARKHFNITVLEEFCQLYIVAYIGTVMKIAINNYAISSS